MRSATAPRIPLTHLPEPLNAAPDHALSHTLHSISPGAQLWELHSLRSTVTPHGSPTAQSLNELPKTAYSLTAMCRLCVYLSVPSLLASVTILPSNRISELAQSVCKGNGLHRKDSSLPIPSICRRSVRMGVCCKAISQLQQSPVRVPADLQRTAY